MSAQKSHKYLTFASLPGHVFLPNLRTEARAIAAGPNSTRHESLRSLRMRLRQGYVGEFAFVPWEAVLVPNRRMYVRLPGYRRYCPIG